ncbi:hypothetical protein BASA50_000155 [Batrachochytrium salamandrivorans]|uniref:Homeobox domain-containing protein n=1 Tax=Batrachochytrium salamandrivorans TaxID=1357716 RepID=A0ABQ8EUF2_9FUNG|nr:hypothetical protein BASA62_004826 [Batrachochytrium salamandrivorans]KAH6586790.1 hypothetical protein BASA50_000155 [Batrachochytrium salamandrivorans]KAH6592683.1 hypothetical protein BASA61_004484 [Batrachochytrium salamandrivorans]
MASKHYSLSTILPQQTPTHAVMTSSPLLHCGDTGAFASSHSPSRNILSRPMHSNGNYIAHSNGNNKVHTSNHVNTNGKPNTNTSSKRVNWFVAGIDSFSEEGVLQTLRKKRRRITDSQLQILNSAFADNPFPSLAEREQLAGQTGMSIRMLQVWFQNKRQTMRRLADLEMTTGSGTSGVSISSVARVTTAAVTADAQMSGRETTASSRSDMISQLDINQQQHHHHHHRQQPHHHRQQPQYRQHHHHNHHHHQYQHRQRLGSPTPSFDPCTQHFAIGVAKTHTTTAATLPSPTLGLKPPLLLQIIPPSNIRHAHGVALPEPSPTTPVQPLVSCNQQQHHQPIHQQLHERPAAYPLTPTTTPMLQSVLPYSPALIIPSSSQSCRNAVSGSSIYRSVPSISQSVSPVLPPLQAVSLMPSSTLSYTPLQHLSLQSSPLQQQQSTALPSIIGRRHSPLAYPSSNMLPTLPRLSFLDQPFDPCYSPPTFSESKPHWYSRSSSPASSQSTYHSPTFVQDRPRQGYADHVTPPFSFTSYETHPLYPASTAEFSNEPAANEDALTVKILLGLQKSPRDA